MSWLIRHAGVQPALLVSKWDLIGDPQSLQPILDAYRQVMPVFIAGKGLDHDEVLNYLKGKIAVLTGQSGVGKSSLINGLIQRKKLARTSAQPGKTQTINFYNVFAANDPDSTARIINMVTGNLQNVSKIIILNSRSDRLFRSEQLLDAIKDLEFCNVLLTGEIPEKVEAYALKIGIPKDKVISLGEPLTEVIYKKVLELTKGEAHVLGIGNIAGRIKYGAQIVAHFKHKMIALNKVKKQGAERG